MPIALTALVLAQIAGVQPVVTGAHVGEIRPDSSETTCGAVVSPEPAAEPAPGMGQAARTCGPFAIPPQHWRDLHDREGPDDAWFAVDKVQHFAMAYGTAMFGYAILRGAGAPHGDAQAAAIAGSLGAGIGKEIFDRARGGPFSLKDLTWDALGTLAAWGLLSLNR